MEKRRWTDSDRETAKRYAAIPAGQLPNGPQACAFHQASIGLEDDVLFGVHLILQAAKLEFCCYSHDRMNDPYVLPGSR